MEKSFLLQAREGISAYTVVKPSTTTQYHRVSPWFPHTGNSSPTMTPFSSKKAPAAQQQTIACLLAYRGCKGDMAEAGKKGVHQLQWGVIGVVSERNAPKMHR
jgi:hypothetical protein